MRFPLPWALLIGLLLPLGSCQRQAAKPPAAAPATVPAARTFTLTLSSGDGFTGAYAGCTFTSEGAVRSWRRSPGGAETVEWESRGSPDSVAALAKALEPFLASELKETGNMTLRIRYASPDTAREWSVSGAGASAGAPEPFRTWYPRAEAWCRSQAPGP
jgi:hypothetical protein